MSPHDGSSRPKIAVIRRYALFLLLSALCALAASPAPRLAAQSPIVEPQGVDAEIQCQIDVMLVIDGSGSISATDFGKIVKFSTDLVGAFNVGPQGTHVGVVQFGSQGTARLESRLSGDIAALNDAIMRMPQLRGNTDIEEGLSRAGIELSINGRAGFPSVIVLLTDGAHNQAGDPIAVAKEFKDAGRLIYVIAVGSAPNNREIELIASSPATRYVYRVEDETGLAQIRDSLATNVCNCRQSTAASGETVSRVTEGICLRVQTVNGKKIRIGIINLADPDIKVKLLHHFSDQAAGTFFKHSVKGFADRDDELVKVMSVYTGLPAPHTFMFSYVHSRLFVAVNGSGFNSKLPGLPPLLTDTSSPDSILALDGALYSDRGKASPANPIASFLAYQQNQATIHRAFKAGQQLIDPGYFQGDVQELERRIAGVEFAVGYGPTLWDTHSDPAFVYPGDGPDQDPFEEKTLVGASADGKTLYLVSSDYGLTAREVADALATPGNSTPIDRAILLDGGSSSQFLALSEDFFGAIHTGICVEYFCQELTLRPRRHVLNAVVAYSIADLTQNSVPIPLQGGEFVVSPNTTAMFSSRTFTTSVAITQLPLVIAQPSSSPAVSEANTVSTLNVSQAGTYLTTLLTAPTNQHLGIAYSTSALASNGAVLQPQVPYTIEARFNALVLPPTLRPSELGIYLWDGVNWNREPSSRVDLARNTVTARLSRFGIWALMAPVQSYLPFVGNNSNPAGVSPHP